MRPFADQAAPFIDHRRRRRDTFGGTVPLIGHATSAAGAGWPLAAGVGTGYFLPFCSPGSFARYLAGSFSNLGGHIGQQNMTVRPL